MNTASGKREPCFWAVEHPFTYRTERTFMISVAQKTDSLGCRLTTWSDALLLPPCCPAELFWLKPMYIGFFGISSIKIRWWGLQSRSVISAVKYHRLLPSVGFPLFSSDNLRKQALLWSTNQARFPRITALMFMSDNIFVQSLKPQNTQ